MEYLFLALAGWVAGGWAVSFGSGAGLYPRPDGGDGGWPIPWPPCLVCGGLAGLISAVILYALLARIAADLPIGPIGPQLWTELAAFGFVAGGAAGLALNAFNRLRRGPVATK